MTSRQVYEALKTLELPVAYGRFEVNPALPFIAYMGDGQEQFKADDTVYFKGNSYRIEYYFKVKDDSAEAAIEELLTENGWHYTKSEDIYIESEDVFEIYYQI